MTYNWIGAARVTKVDSSASSTQIVAANKSRKGLYLYNSDANAAYVKFGTTATATDFTVKTRSTPAPSMRGRSIRSTRAALTRFGPPTGPAPCT
jgi:hypothetical protein